jgi:hypothetical protein
MMDRTEKIMGMLTLLELNNDQFSYEMTSLAVKINNFLDDRSRLLSGQWLSVMYKSLTEENDIDTAEIDIKLPVETGQYENVEIGADRISEIDDFSIFYDISHTVHDSRFALVK